MPNTILKFAGRYYCVIGCIVPDILKDHSALTFRAKQSKQSLPDPEVSGNKILSNMSNHSPNASATSNKI